MLNSKHNEDEIDDEDNLLREDANLFAGISKIALGNFNLLAQYLTKTVSYEAEKEDITTTAISLVPTYKLNNTLDIVTRYDIYNPNTDIDDNGYNTIMAGLNYYLIKDAKNKPKLFVQANYQIKQFQDDDKDNENELMVQLRWIFSEKINAK